ncbi:MAG: hypothetical protein C0403_06010 [Desulfobacterium sp.]|nr:hypothetical protein [Desulfobacterium sp.]
MKVFTTDLSVRIHKDTPKDFFKEAISVFKSTSGIAFYPEIRPISRLSIDGRKAFEPISNSLSPANGTEKNGITAILNSVAKLDYQNFGNGVAVNVRIHPQNLEHDEHVEKFYFLLKTYFDKGGMQIQLNVVLTETLRDAQQNPEKYKDLIVKVGGYNATYIDLGLPIQNEIINRLENRI